MFCLFFTIWDGLVHIAACKVLREKSQIFVLKIQVGISKFQNKILGRNKRVTIFHVAWIECNCKLITEIRFCRKNNHFSTFTMLNWKSFLIVTLFFRLTTYFYDPLLIMAQIIWSWQCCRLLSGNIANGIASKNVFA